MSSHSGWGQLRIIEGPDVLVVDDDPEQARQIAGFLDKRGIAVTMETSGPAAISAIQRDSPKVVVMDVNMPTVDGIEVTRQAMAGDVKPIIILMSGEPESGRRGASRRPSSHTTGHTFYVPRRFPSVCNARYLSATGTRPCRTNQARVMASVAW